jgi:alkanesulfonate monooxygenase SsuD/methylene tetrahydromethanopterin reductase-like flavin-dependent oxidoreductase (luciferase family)
VLSEGRLVLGLGVGAQAREDDFIVSNVDFHTRGKRFDALLADMVRIWSGDEHDGAPAIGPDLSNLGPPPLVMGGTSDAAMQRMARYGAGWIAVGGSLEAFKANATRVRDVWTSAGRKGGPILVGGTYFSLGPDGGSTAERFLRTHYGPTRGTAMARAALTDQRSVRDEIKAFEDAGCSELVLFSCSADPVQVDRLAEMVRGEIL